MHEAMAEHALARAYELGAWNEGEACDALVQVALLPTFHRAVRIALVEEDLYVAVAMGDALADSERVLLSGPEAAALRALVGLAERPRAVDDGRVLDGMVAAVRLGGPNGPATLGVHVGMSLPGDPVLEVATAVLAAALRRSRRRETRRALEAVAAYLPGFRAVRVEPGPPIRIRLVHRLTFDDRADLERALARVGDAEAVVDLADCEFVAGMFWAQLLAFAKRHPRASWRAGEELADALAAGGVPTARIERLGG